MDGFLCLNFSFSNCRNFRAILVFLWTSGLLAGGLLALLPGSIVAKPSLLGTAFDITGTGILILPLLPFLLTWISVYTSQRWMLLLLVFAKAFLFSYNWVWFLLAFGSPGWLIRVFMMFADSLTVPILWLTWFRIDPQNSNSALFNCFFGTLGALLISCVDYAVIAPFCARLILL